MAHEEHAGPRFSASLAFALNNPFKRLLDHTPQEFIRLLGVKPDWAVVDFGCGPGFYTVPFARIARKVVGVDVQPEMLRKAESYARKSKVKAEFVESDGSSIPLPSEGFDLVFLNHVYHEIENKKATLLEFRRLLKLGGIVAIREKTENTLFPIGPPILQVEVIRTGLEDARFGEIRVIGRKGRRIVTGTKTLG